MPDASPATPERQAIRAVAMLCGSLLGAVREAGLVSREEQEALLAALEAGSGAAGPLLTAVLDDVRWAAESAWRTRPARHGEGEAQG